MQQHGYNGNQAGYGTSYSTHLSLSLEIINDEAFPCIRIFHSGYYAVQAPFPIQMTSKLLAAHFFEARSSLAPVLANALSWRAASLDRNSLSEGNSAS